MEIATKKFARVLLGLALVSFLSVAFFGISQTVMGMEKQSDGNMSGCLFSGKAEICTMTFSEHVGHWQAMFTTTAPQKVLSFVLLILAVVFVAVAILKRNLLLLSSYHATRWRLYIKQNPNLSLFNPLREAFSSGILHPKIF
jgi:hypothetical protein